MQEVLMSRRVVDIQQQADFSFLWDNTIKLTEVLELYSRNAQTSPLCIPPLKLEKLSSQENA
jgi:hypothetical protein